MNDIASVVYHYSFDRFFPDLFPNFPVKLDYITLRLGGGRLGERGQFGD
jgi:hypothetical protein